MTQIAKTIYEDCLGHYEDVERHPCVVKNAIPIPYFGDLRSYLGSDRRILTAALNPSNQEFPDPPKRSRFDMGKARSGAEAFEIHLSAYFEVNPYRRWFDGIEPVLTGLEASYYPRDGIRQHCSTALHIDLCSPIATFPTWSRLEDEETKTILRAFGKKLFGRLLDELKPDIVLSSVGWRHLQAWGSSFADWQVTWDPIVAFDTTKYGKPWRGAPLEARARWMRSHGGHPYLFVNASAAQTPFGLFSTERKVEVGRKVADYARSPQA